MSEKGIVFTWRDLWDVVRPIFICLLILLASMAFALGFGSVIETVEPSSPLTGASTPRLVPDWTSAECGCRYCEAIK